ncbi:MAG: YfhO family protein [Acidobacteria bacterium]|nr:YfhO family protein [Acidobacteriota bacterium]
MRRLIDRARWRRVWRSRRADARVGACVVIFFALFFVRALLAGRFLIAADAFYQSYPLRSVAWQMIRAGVAPVWTPLVLSGYPFLSMGQLSLGYPLTWGYLFLPARWGEQIYLLAPFLLSPIFTYAYAREIRRSRPAALLAGLAYTFGGGMTSKLAVVGFHTNSLLWLPLLLVPVERARTRRFVPCLLGATAAYAPCVLNGYGQGFLYVAIVAVLYAAFVSLTNANDDRRDDVTARGWRTRWRPLAVAACGVVLSAGVGAFQILETMRAARRSIRGALAYEVYSAGAFSPAEAVRSFVAPLYHYIEVSVYVAPLAAGLALYAVVKYVRGRGRGSGGEYGRGGGDVRIVFWAALALLMFVLMLGSATPLNRLLYHVPVYNRFRYASRHAFEWSLAVSVLAAYGWDALRLSRARAAVPVSPRRAAWSRRHAAMLTALAWLALALVVAVGVGWWRAAQRPSLYVAAPDTGQGTGLPEASYVVWKLCFTILVGAALWLASRAGAARRRTRLSLALIMCACFFEPFLMTGRWWLPDAKPASRLRADAPVTRYLQQFPPAENRVYTRVNIYLLGYPANPPRIDLPNMTALAGLQNLAGYEQLILERYSRALGNAGPDAVNPRYDVKGEPDRTLFDARSHVLDLLNATHVVTFEGLQTAPVARASREGAQFSTADLRRILRPGETATLSGVGAGGDALALVTSLADSVDVADGETVALVRVHASDGRTVERELRAGADTAEWAHERADVRSVIKHRLAPVFDSTPGDAADSFPAERYLALVPLGGRLSVERVEVTSVARRATVALWKASVYDGASQESAPLAAGSPLDPSRWRVTFDEGGVLALENRRACPRAWLVAGAEAVDGEEALRRIRGEPSLDGVARDFDPRRTALVEAGAAELPRLPGGALAPDASARVVAYEANRLTVETDAPTATVLVVGEIFYPGWEARVDGRASPILLTDYLLRGVALPPGAHTVEMRYRAPAARNGAIISALTLSLLAALAAAWRRSARPRWSNARAGG